MENKKRLIDANALYEFIQDQMVKETGAYTKGKNQAFNIVKSALHNECATPTVDAVVLPCKVGESVYRIYVDCDFSGDCGTKRMCNGCEYRNLFIEEQAFCLSMLKQNGSFNHPYYLTREEAEAALAERVKGNE